MQEARSCHEKLSQQKPCRVLKLPLCLDLRGTGLYKQVSLGKFSSLLYFLAVFEILASLATVFGVLSLVSSSF